MKIRVFIALILILFLISGCASSPLPSAETAPAPVESPPEIVAEPAEPAPPTLTVHFLSTGQSDCIFLECGDQTLLIDSGTAEMAPATVNYLTRQGLEDLDYVISTHGHYDHVGGFPAVFDRFPVGKLYAIKTDYSATVYHKFLKSLETHNLSITEPHLGEQFLLGNAVVTFLGPVRSYEKLNDNSIVVKVEYGQRTFLLAADAESAAELDMLEYWGDLFSWNADVLKVGHHGLSTSSTWQFAQAVCPEYAVSTTSHKTRSNHTKQTLQDVGAAFYRTDSLGPIIFSTDGTDLNVVWSNRENIPEYPQSTAELHYYGSALTGQFHMDRCPSLLSTQDMTEFISFETALYHGMIPCDLCLGNAFG